MNLVELRRLLDNAEADPAAITLLVSNLRDAVFKGQKRRDPLGTYIMEARWVYRTALRFDKSKSGKSVSHLLDRQYVDAQHLGWNDTRRDRCQPTKLHFKVELRRCGPTHNKALLLFRLRQDWGL